MSKTTRVSPPPAAKSDEDEGVQVNVRIPTDALEKVDAAAKREERSRPKQVKLIVKQWAETQR